MLKFSDDVPSWVKDWTEFLIDALGLDTYKLYIEMTDYPNPELQGTDGAAYLNERYHQATIRLRRGMADDDDGRSLVVHELLHVRLSALSRLAEHTEHLLPKRERRVYGERYCDAEEQAIEGLARSLTPLLVKFVVEPEPAATA